MTEQVQVAARWGGSLALVLALQAGAVAGVLAWDTHAPASAPPLAALMIELAPLPSAPQTIPAEKPPAEKPPTEKPETVEKPQPKKPDSRPKAPVVKKADVALDQPQEKPAERETPKVEEANALPSLQTPPSEVAAAPAQGASMAPPSSAVATWQGTLLAHLERHKRYPRSAQLGRQQGVSIVAFTIDRQGNVVVQRLHRSSGHEVLDEETLALLLRAHPLPPPPPEVAGERIDLVVPVQFFLKS